MSTSALSTIPQASSGASILDAHTARQAAHAPPAAPAAKGPRRNLVDLMWMVFFWAIPLAVTATFWSYYSQSQAIRLRHPMQAWLKPSGYVGLSLGVLAFAMFLFLWLYPFRKKVKWLAWTGPLGTWMRVHTISGIAIPVLAAVHAGWRFNGMVGLGFWAMVVVSLSGVVGRYLYIHIPRHRNGLEMTLDEVATERRALLAQIAAASGLEPGEVERRLAVDPTPTGGLNPLRTVWRMFKHDIARLRLLRELERALAEPNADHMALGRHELRATMRLAQRELKLSQQVRMLDATRKVFGYWHVAHRPFAVTALVAVLFHVIVATFVGGVGFPGR